MSLTYTVVTHLSTTKGPPERAFQLLLVRRSDLEHGSKCVEAPEDDQEHSQRGDYGHHNRDCKEDADDEGNVDDV